MNAGLPNEAIGGLEIHTIQAPPIYSIEIDKVLFQKICMKSVPRQSQNHCFLDANILPLFR